MPQLRRDSDKRWFVSKEFLSILVGLGLQSAAGIWWAATISAKVDTMDDRLKEARSEKYTKDDARRDIDRQSDRDREFERRIALLEARLSKDK